jgi:hypothetical protein
MFKTTGFFCLIWLVRKLLIQAFGVHTILSHSQQPPLPSPKGEAKYKYTDYR